MSPVTPERGARGALPPLARAAPLVAWTALAAALAWRFQGRAMDDMFITYRYADNLAAGRGLVFNPGERVFGLTEPGWGLLLGVLHRLTGIAIPTLGTLLTGAALVAIAALVLAVGRERSRLAEALTGGTLVVASPYLWSCQGAAGPLVLLLLLAAARWGERRPAAAGLAAGLAVWGRPDAAVGAALAGLLLWLGRRRFPFRFALAGGATVATGIVAAWAWFGTPLPNTLLAKRLHAARNPGSWLGFEAFWGSFLRAFVELVGPGAWILVLAGVAGQWLLLRRLGPPGALLAANAAALVGVYPLLAVPFFRWYAVPVAVALLYGAATAAVGAWRGLAAVPAGGRRMAARGAAVLLLAALALALLGAEIRWWREADAGNWRLAVYRDAATWIRRHSAPHEGVAFLEVGTLAFYSDRPVQDLLALVTARSLPYARSGDVEGAFRASPTPFFLAHDYQDIGAVATIVRRDWFRTAYRPVARARYPDGHVLVIYRRRPGAELPPPRPPRPLRRLP